MSFGSSGFGGGFGQNNNNTTPGFGSGGGFGNTGGSAFGSNNAGSGFGSNANTNTSIFGSGNTGGGFGANNTSSGFGSQAKPAFGGTTTTGGGIFGSSNNTSGGFGGGTGGGGFGASSTTNTGFGSNSANTGGGLFGQNKTSSFGTSGTSPGLFGSGTNNTAVSGGFGSSAANTNSGSLFAGNQNASSFGNTAEATGTAGHTFVPFQEKESNSSITNHFQSISFMTPFAKHSFEELRLADYAKGQKHGNAGGQAGAFGQSTGFGSGGFGSTNNNTANSGFGGNTGGGIFGGAATTGTSSGFGSNTATSGAFGGGTGGGLFGQKPAATGGLFGGAGATTATNPGFGGGGGGFGSGTQQNQQNQQNNNLFGGANNQAKPAGLFGNPSTNTTGGFGAAAASSGSNLFGGSNNTQQQQPANSLFGGQPQQQQNSNPFGGGTTAATTSGFGGGFGTNTATNQAKPGGLFGTGGNTGGGIFGTNQQQQAGGFGTNQAQQQNTGLFGGTTQNQTAGGGGLFGGGNTQPKPGLFGTAGTNTGGGLFGTNQQQSQPQSTSLFGTQPQQQNSGFSGGLFGGNNNQQNNQPANSLFGGNQNNSSIMGNSQQQQNPLQGPAGYTASLSDPSPYGSASIFNGLPPPPQNSPGPIATPINGGSLRARKPAALPQYKLNPSAASRLLTPQKRGYGLSYSTYGTPSSVSSVTSTPGALSSSLLGGSLGRSLGKSLSTSNLRSQLEAEPSVLGAGALSGSLRGGSNGSLKRLTIDRSLRTDLFSSQQIAPPPAPKQLEDARPTSNLRKKVSFDTTPTSQLSTETDGERDASQTPTPQDQGYVRSSRSANSRKSMPTQPEMEQIRGNNELEIVHEDDAMSGTATSAAPKSKPNVFDQGEPVPGEYYMRPSLAELKRMTREELKAVHNFKVGRVNTGYVEFIPPVDLTTIDLDDIPEAIVVISRRNLTVYPENSIKPAQGKALNVPAKITLENCWPRSRDRVSRSHEKDGPRVKKHIANLKKANNTEFVNYNVHTGEWVFKVEHFTTYGMDDSDDEDDDESVSSTALLGESVLSGAPPTPTPKGKQVRKTSLSTQEIPPSSSALSSVPSEMTGVDFDESLVSSAPGDDTFGYRRGKRFPGAFDDMPAFDDSDHGENDTEMVEIGDDSAGAASPGSSVSEPEPVDMGMQARNQLTAVTPIEEDMAMAGAYPHVEEEDPYPALDTPIKLIPDLNDDWAERLQHTISPRKNDRLFLKQSQALLDRGDSLLDIDTTPTARKNTATSGNDMGEIKTSVDLMRSLFGKEESRRSQRKEKTNGIQWPYNKSETNNDPATMNDQDKAFHQSFKPSFTPDHRILVRESGNHLEVYNVDEEPKDYSAHNFWRLARQTKISLRDGVPVAEFEPQAFSQDWGVKDLAHEQETTAWQLLHILFDNYADEISQDIPASEIASLRHRIRKDRFAVFWAQLCEPAATRALSRASSHEERALIYLSMHKVVDACNALIEDKNFRLATLVAQIGGDTTQHAIMQDQLEAWTTGNVVSEINDEVRAIFSLLAGETAFVTGKKGPVENKAESFVMSERFGLDWRRTFGLKLWYGTQPEDSLETAVLQYAADLASGDEPQKPIPWFLDSGRSTISGWTDPSPQSRLDLLWAILVLIAEENQDKPTLKLAQALAPENAVGSPTNYRLSFELHQMLASRLPRTVDFAAADALVTAFSASLESFARWQSALWVLMFLHDPEVRKHALQTALARMAPHLTDEAEVRTVVFDNLKLPESWVWDAKALKARADGDKPAEVTFLARAHKWVDAHRVLCEEVAPLAVIERSHVKLHLILKNFPQKQIPDWRLGGQVYEDYLSLVGGKLGNPEARVVVTNLVHALGELSSYHGDRRKMSFAQNVALSELARVATDKANEIAEEGLGGRESMKLLDLPGNEEVRRRNLGEVGMQHFRAVMAGSA